MTICQKQSGTYTVEFAIVGSVFFMVLFAVMEIGRLMFTWNVLTEISRRGARLATVCNITQTVTTDGVVMSAPLSVKQLAYLDIPPNFTTDNLRITFLDLEGERATNRAEIRLVRAEIINYNYRMIIPTLSLELNSPSFKTTIVSESLGAVPGDDYTECTAT